VAASALATAETGRLTLRGLLLEVARSPRGFRLGGLAISHCCRPVPALDDWLSRRIRMCDWKP
jgi:hypothetical protein